MKQSNIFWGILLVGLGTLLLFDRLGVFDFHWWAFARLWPFLIILWGVSILPVKDGLKLLLAVLVLAGGVWMYSQNTEASFAHKGFHYRWDWDDDAHSQDEAEADEETYQRVDQSFNEPYDSVVANALLTMEAGAGVFTMKGSTGELIYAENKGFGNQFQFKVERIGQEAKILVKQDSEIKVRNHEGNRFNLMLNTSPVWDFNFDIGAAEFDFDLSNHKVRNIDIDGGAASIELKLGALQPETDVRIEAGATSIEIRVPASVGCRVTGSTVLSSKNLNGFNKIEKGLYETPGYESASQKIRIKVDAAISSFSVIRED